MIKPNVIQRADQLKVFAALISAHRVEIKPPQDVLDVERFNAERTRTGSMERAEPGPYRYEVFIEVRAILKSLNPSSVSRAPLQKLQYLRCAPSEVPSEILSQFPSASVLISSR